MAGQFADWICRVCGDQQPCHSFQCGCGADRPEQLDMHAQGQPSPMGMAAPPGMQQQNFQGQPAPKRAKLEESAPEYDPFPFALVGKMVEVRGLNSKPELNGKRGLVNEFHASASRYTVEMDGGRGSFKLKRENLVDVANIPAAQVTVPAQDPLIGRTVEIQGLVAKPELNGAFAIVREFHAEVGRYTVEVDGGRGTFKLKPDNLRDISFDVPVVPEGAPESAPTPQGSYTTHPAFPGMVFKTITISANQKGAIIGAGGEQINKIRQESHAQVKIDALPGQPDMASLELKGSMLQVEVADRMVQERLSESSNKGWGKSANPGDWPCPSCGASVFASKDACFKCGAGRPTPQSAKKFIDVPKQYIAAVIGKGGCFLKEMSEQTKCKISFQSAAEHDPTAEWDKQICVIQGSPELLPFAEQTIMAKVAEVSASELGGLPALFGQDTSSGNSAWSADKGWSASGGANKWSASSNGSANAAWSDNKSGASSWSAQDKWKTKSNDAKQEVCPFFLKGFCGFGDKCNKAHSEAPSVQKEVCPFFLKGFCGFGDKCNKAHSEAPSVQKEVCPFHLKGSCSFGDQCNKSHSQDNNGGTPSVQKEVCPFFLKGSCSFGDQCNKSHSQDNNGEYNAGPTAQQPGPGVDQPPAKSPLPCQNFANGSCKYGDWCGYTHAEPGMQPPAMQPPAMQPPAMQPPAMQPPAMQPLAMQAPSHGGMSCPMPMGTSWELPSMPELSSGTPSMSPPSMSPPSMSPPSMSPPSMYPPSMSPPGLAMPQPSASSVPAAHGGGGDSWSAWKQDSDAWKDSSSGSATWDAQSKGNASWNGKSDGNSAWSPQSRGNESWGGAYG